MKKERKLKLEVKKVSISKLNNIFGGNDPISSVDLPCVITTVVKTIVGVDCKTGDTKTNRSLVNCIGVDSREC
ncbi:hypothetical protein [Kordia sp.]|uniref:hypothetical protein n=1 Tax=Kordia sp. TaxID=1965332 RepID=UPI003D27E438